jgi:hypothetical protein
VKSDLCFSDKSRIGREILAYLLEHPDAEDTVDGIVQWWLLERKIKHQGRLVKDAVSELVDKGYLAVEQVRSAHAGLGERQAKNGPRYSLNKSKIVEIQEVFNKRATE